MRIFAFDRPYFSEQTRYFCLVCGIPRSVKRLAQARLARVIRVEQALFEGCL